MIYLLKNENRIHLYQLNYRQYSCLHGKLTNKLFKNIPYCSSLKKQFGILESFGNEMLDKLIEKFLNIILNIYDCFTILIAEISHWDIIVYLITIGALSHFLLNYLGYENIYLESILSTIKKPITLFTFGVYIIGKIIYNYFKNNTIVDESICVSEILESLECENCIDQELIILVTSIEANSIKIIQNTNKLL